jgi:Fe-S cluster assembly protein SufD
MLSVAEMAYLFLFMRYLAPELQIVGLAASVVVGGAAHFLINFVIIDEGAEAHVWEELEGSAAFVSSFTSVHLGDNAKGGFYYLQEWSDQTAHFQFQDITQGAYSKFNAVAVEVGGRIFHNETTVNLKGTGAENKVLGLLFGEGNQNFENWVTQNHIATKTTSDIQYRGALKGFSKSFFSGMVSIEKQAQQSDAYQAAKYLLLSKDARADAIPNLEILADDVKCSHGAAVGPVDEDQKYYMQTRGIPPLQAEDIIVEGFFEPVLAELPSEAVQERLRTFVEEKLHRV